MKHFNKYFVILISLMIFNLGCSDDSSSDSNPLGIGGLGETGGNGSVSFTIGSTNGQQGGVVFTASPSVAVKITKVTLNLTAQQFQDVVQGDGTTTFQANQAVEIGEYTGVGSGQAWTFQFEGTLAADGKAFNVTSNYTVP